MQTRRLPAILPALLSALLPASLLLMLLLALVSGCSYSRILRDRLPQPHRVEGGVLFQYEAPQARHVNLCGNWTENDWCGTQGTGRFDHTIGVMTDEDGDGVWEIVLPLPAGRYQYKFALDYGVRWEPDPNNPVGEEDGYGGHNSVLILR